MTNSFNEPTHENISSKPESSLDLPGKITGIIGSGKHAQAAIVWQTIKWSFIAGVILTLLVFVGSYFDSKLAFTVDSVTTIWAIFIPLITLALGYIFGKGKE